MKKNPRFFEFLLKGKGSCGIMIPIGSVSGPTEKENGNEKTDTDIAVRMHADRLRGHGEYNRSHV